MIGGPIHIVIGPPIPTRIETAYPEEVAWIRREDGEESYQRHDQAGHILYLVDGRLRWLPPQGCNVKT